MTMLAALILGILGNVMSILSYASPLPTFWKIVTERSVGDFNEQPYLWSLINAILWTYYGVEKENAIMIVIVNVIGFAFHFMYLLLYWCFSIKKKKVLMLMWGGCIIVGCATYILFMELLLERIVNYTTKKMHHNIHELQLLVMGVMANLSYILMFTSPLSVMGLVIRTRSVEYMPFLLSLSLLLRSGTWCGYGFATHDIFVKIPNAIAMFLGVVQILLYVYFCKNTRPIPIPPNFIMKNTYTSDIVENDLMNPTTKYMPSLFTNGENNSITIDIRRDPQKEVENNSNSQRNLTLLT